MRKLENLEFGENVLYSTGYFSGNYEQILYLKRSIDDGSKRPKFYLSVFSNIHGELVQQGYLYFYLDYVEHVSYFIGIKVHPKYRDLHIGSFLIAHWIHLCFDYGYDVLGVNQKQRKPFLLYLLKTYGFELSDLSLYESSPDVIFIAKSILKEDHRKFLLFRDSKHERAFMKTNIYRSDNYVIAHNDTDLIILDQVLLPLQNRKRCRADYMLLDYDLASKKSQFVLSRHKE